MNNSVELSSNLDPEPLKEWNWNSAAHPTSWVAQLVRALVCKPVGWCRVRVRIRSRSYNRNIKWFISCINQLNSGWCQLSLTYKYIHYLTVTLLNNSVELSSNLDPEPLKEWNWNSAAHPISWVAQLVGALVCKPVGWCRVRVRIRSRSYNRNIKWFISCINQLNSGWCQLSLTYKYIHYLTVALLNNSDELSSNLDPEPLKEWNWNSAAHPISRVAQLVGALVCKPVGWCRVRVRIRARSYNRNIKWFISCINQLNSGWC